MGGFVILTRHDIQLKLLNEIDEICSKNDLHYFLIGANALSAYNNHTIDNGSRMVAVAMPSGDIEIFSNIIKREYKKDRYVQKSINDKEDSSYFIAYGDKNTSFFHLRNLDTHKPHGIIIRIYPLRKSITDGEDIKRTLGIRYSMKQSINIFIRKHNNTEETFYVKYGIILLRKIFNILVKLYKFLNFNNSKAFIKERLFDIFGRNSWFTNFLLDIYRHIYSAIDATYFFFKNLRKHPFIETWEDLKIYGNTQIINKNISAELLENIDKSEVDGINLNLPGSEFFYAVFGKNYENRKVSSKPFPASAILDTEISYQDIIKKRRKYINEIKAIQREVRKTRFEVIEETQAVNNIFKLVKMTDAQIKVQRFFDRRREYLFSLDMDDEEEFIELYDRLTPTINYLRRFAENDMTFSIDQEADSLVREVLMRIGEADLVYKLDELLKIEYFVE